MTQKTVCTLLVLSTDAHIPLASLLAGVGLSWRVEESETSAHGRHGQSEASGTDTSEHGGPHTLCEQHVSSGSTGAPGDG